MKHMKLLTGPLGAALCLGLLVANGGVASAKNASDSTGPTTTNVVVPNLPASPPSIPFHALTPQTLHTLQALALDMQNNKTSGGVGTDETRPQKSADSPAGDSVSGTTSSSKGGWWSTVKSIISKLSSHPDFDPFVGTHTGTRAGIRGQLLLEPQQRNAKGIEPGVERLAKAPFYFQANAETAPAMAGLTDADVKALSASAQRLTGATRHFSEIFGILTNDRGEVNPLVVGPANVAARSLRSALSDYVKQLQKVPAKSLNPDQLLSMSKVVDDTTNWTTVLETLAPLLSEMSKSMNSANS